MFTPATFASRAGSPLSSRAYRALEWTEVIALANSYGQTQAQTVAAGTAGGIAVDWALAQIGTPYIWGGESPGVGFDCSGLVQAAYEVAGITLSRVAQDQFDAGPQLPAGTPLEPEDLVFFGGGPGDVSHVGLVCRHGKRPNGDGRRPPHGRLRSGRTVRDHARRGVGRQRRLRRRHPTSSIGFLASDTTLVRPRTSTLGRRRRPLGETQTVLDT